MTLKASVWGAVMLLAMTGAALAQEPELGTLPPGSLSTAVTSGVQAEICRDHLFDPASVPLKLPEGYRLRSAGELAESDPALAALLKSNPAAKTHAVGSLCLMSFKTFVVDGTPAFTSGTMSAAFWWAAADGPLHADMRGKARWVQIGSWYARNIGREAQILRTDPMAQFTKVEVKKVSMDKWHVKLVLPTETLEADIQVTSPGTQRPSSGPKFMSVPMSGEGAEFFSVYTFAGHRHHEAQGQWSARGNGVFAGALSIPDEASALGTVFQEGWTSRSGLYRFKSASAE